VRECPAKAIRIAEGQAEVISERCIGCGNCVRVCSQKAKKVLGGIEQVQDILSNGVKVAAIIAPSFPVEFAEIDYQTLVGMVRALGFSIVHEVAFGADLVAKEYKNMLASNHDKRYISTACPAIITFVEKYFPHLVNMLIPIVSPMVADARVLHQIYGNDIKIVFIGPCIAKKGEASSQNIEGEVDAVLTFSELREMFDVKDIKAKNIVPGEFDGPQAGIGAIFPISRGSLQAANIEEDLIDGEVIATDGRSKFIEAIEEFGSGDLDARLLEVLCCNGCIMGAGITSNFQLFTRRASVSNYVRKKMQTFDQQAWLQNIKKFSSINLHRTFTANDQRGTAPFEEEKISTIMKKMGKFRAEDELNCGACGYDTCRDHAMAINKGLAESEMCLPYTIEQLRRIVKELADSNRQLISTQEALMQSEKLASMGQLAAGIAHEVNNPLGVVLMYAHLLLDETKNSPALRDDLTMIAEQADRCKNIVAGLLHFARQNKVLLHETDINVLVTRSIKAIAIPDGITLNVENKADDPTAELDNDQIIQVLTNLVTNAIAAMPNGGTLTICTGGDNDSIRFIVTDTGIGIPKENIPKIFEPFFTTKQIGKGTGLGLAVTYGIVKMHRGSIDVVSNADPAAGPTGTAFTVILPRKGLKD
jgi:signal transduction histidine kinase/iron only hydrogenase large subunit-like protein